MSLTSALSTSSAIAAKSAELSPVVSLKSRPSVTTSNTLNGLSSPSRALRSTRIASARLGRSPGKKPMSCNWPPISEALSKGMGCRLRPYSVA